MTVVVNTNTTLASGPDFDIGTNSKDGTVIVDLDLNGLAANSHGGIAFNRQGIRLGSAGLGGAVAQANQSRLWEEATGPIFYHDGSVHLEQWFRRATGEPEFLGITVGSIGANKLIRVTHTTTGTTRSFSVHAIPSLGGAIGTQLVAPVTYQSGASSEMRSGFFSPFVLAGSLTYRCTRKD